LSVISVDAELVWTAELQRRQEAHVDEVGRRLRALPPGKPVHLRYGPGREATGVIEELDHDLAQVRIAENWTRWARCFRSTPSTATR